MNVESLAMHITDDPKWISEAMEEMALTIKELWHITNPQLAERYLSERSIRMCEALDKYDVNS